MAPQFHTEPDTYLDRIRSALPRFDELQDAAINAIDEPPERVLELGFGTAETTQRLLDRFPAVRITGLDSSSEMVFKARELGWEDLRLGRIEDPLPDGPWDLVIAVLAVHHLDADQKKDLFRRVREQSRALVLGDQVAAETQSLEPEEGVDFLDAPEQLAEWCGGEVVWQGGDLAVIRAVYG